MSWILWLALLQIEEKKIDKPAAPPPVTPGTSLWYSKLQVDASKLRATPVGPLAEKPKDACVELGDNMGDGVLVTARDAAGRAIATAVLKKDGLTEFAHLRALGPVVIRDRFLAPKGDAESWGVFLIDANAGETGTEVPESEVKGKKIRRTYAVYIVSRDDFSWGDYDSDGKLTNAGRAQGMAVQVDHTRERQKGSPHGLWTQVGLALQTDGAKLPGVVKGMTEAVLVTRYEGGVYWRVKRYDKDGKETKTTCLKFTSMPFDAAFDKLVAADKQKWKP